MTDHDIPQAQGDFPKVNGKTKIETLALLLFCFSSFSFLSLVLEQTEVSEGDSASQSLPFLALAG